MVKMKLNSEIEPAQEGLWRRLTYTFTTDFKCASKLDELTKALRKLSGKDEKDFENIEIDFSMQNATTTEKLIPFADDVMIFAKKNVEWMKEMLSWHGFKDAFLGGYQSRAKKIREKFYAMEAKIKRRWNLEQIELSVKGKTPGGNKLEEGKTLKELGFNKSNVLRLIEDFKKQCSGNLKIMKDVRWKGRQVTEEARGNMIIHYLDMDSVNELMNLVVRSYKFIDYFLYYIYKEVC